MLFSLKDLTSKLSPDSQGLDHLHTVKTNGFTLHHYQSPSGLMFVLNSRPEIPGDFFYSLFANAHGSVVFYVFVGSFCLFSFTADLHTHLQYVYSQIYVECVARNPLYHHKPDEPFKSPLFVTRLEEYLFSLVK